MKPTYISILCFLLRFSLNAQCPPNGFTSTLKKPIVSVPGTYTLTVYHPGTGCTNSTDVLVTQH